MTTRNFGDVIRKKLAENPELADAVDEEFLNAHIAEEIFEARSHAGLTQGQLAARAETHQSVIARMESADHEGYNINMLRRIARACGRRLHVDFLVPCRYKDAGTLVLDDIEWEPPEAWTVDVEIVGSGG